MLLVSSRWLPEGCGAVGEGGVNCSSLYQLRETHLVCHHCRGVVGNRLGGEGQAVPFHRQRKVSPYNGVPLVTGGLYFEDGERVFGRAGEDGRDGVGEEVGGVHFHAVATTEGGGGGSEGVDK